MEALCVPTSLPALPHWRWWPHLPPWWLDATITVALRHLAHRNDTTYELTAVAALGAVAALQAVVGPPLLLPSPQVEEWALWAAKSRPG